MNRFFINTPADSLKPGLTLSLLRKSNPLPFHKSLEGYNPTPLVLMGTLSLIPGLKEIYIKDESLRFGLNAFKSLGASYAINQIIKNRPGCTTFCTATDGNHGRAVAWSATREGKESRVFVPASTSQSRIEAIRDEGAIVTVFNGNYDETCQHALKESIRNGWELVQDTAYEGYEEIPALIMAGYTSMFRELENSLNPAPAPRVDIVFLQAGVGSFAASAAWYYQNRYGTRRPKIVIVEPTESDGILESFRQGIRSEPRGNQKTVMAGLNCGIPSVSAWEIIRNAADAVIAVDDRDAMDAMKMLYSNEGGRIISGESGAAGLAGLLRLSGDPALRPVRKHIGLNKESRILLFNTEGDTDPENYRDIINS